MARRLAQHGPREPHDRFEPGFGGYFYPNEVAHALAVRDIDYRQLRRFYLLVRTQSRNPPPPGWSRYTFTDVVCTVVAISLCGGVEALQTGRHFVLGNLADVCEVLIRQGFECPLLHVRLVRQGREVFADINGLLIDPLSGQYLFASVANAFNNNYYGLIDADTRLGEALVSEFQGRYPHEGSL